jgi:1-acyl-sn-glycerol-3-phosphate acyltransferase
MIHEILAAAFLLGLTGLILAVPIHAWSRTSFTLPQYVLFCMVKCIVRIQWGTRISPLPFRKGQGVVVICNHRSSVDPMFIGTAMSWQGHWMVAKEYCQHPAFGWFLRMAEVIPTSRAGVDTAATKMAIRYAAQGEVVGMLPEGRINVSPEFMMPARPGAILVALKAKVPIVPFYIENAPYAGTVWSPFFMRARVRVVVGQPIDLSAYFDRELSSEELRALTLRCLRGIASLAGRDDFEPKIAGRQWKPADASSGNGTGVNAVADNAETRATAQRGADERDDAALN